MKKRGLDYLDRGGRLGFVVDKSDVDGIGTGGVRPAWLYLCIIP